MMWHSFQILFRFHEKKDSEITLYHDYFSTYSFGGCRSTKEVWKLWCIRRSDLQQVWKEEFALARRTHPLGYAFEPSRSRCWQDQKELLTVMTRRIIMHYGLVVKPHITHP